MNTEFEFDTVRVLLNVNRGRSFNGHSARVTYHNNGKNSVVQFYNSYFDKHCFQYLFIKDQVTKGEYYYDVLINNKLNKIISDIFKILSLNQTEHFNFVFYEENERTEFLSGIIFQPFFNRFLIYRLFISEEVHINSHVKNIRVFKDLNIMFKIWKEFMINLDTENKDHIISLFEKKPEFSEFIKSKQKKNESFRNINHFDKFILDLTVFR